MKTTAIPKGYILQCKTTHARFLPTDARHAFAYPTLSFFVSLDSLESGKLDLGRGWVFGYGDGWGLTNIKPSSYLHPEATDIRDGQTLRTIKQKLVRLLDARGYDGNLLEDAWMLSMPRFLGYEGLNPLTVHFCYAGGNQLWIVVLEVSGTDLHRGVGPMLNICTLFRPIIHSASGMLISL